MRVVAGSLRGRRLIAPAGRVVRPTLDRVRESIFNMLESRFDLNGTSVVDLFAGTGALGIEAISRGASDAVFVENYPGALAALRTNLELVADRSRVSVVAQAVERWLDRNVGGGTSYDIAFADPPYAFEGWADLLSRLPAELAVLESSTPPREMEDWELLTQRRYGGTVVTLVRRISRGT